jgi:hypothetical protein
MTKFKVGDKVRITKSLDGYDNAHEELELVEEQKSCEIQTTKKTIMQKLTDYLKLNLSADNQELYKAGYIDGELAPTAKAREFLEYQIFVVNRDAMVLKAKEDNKKEEEKENK